MKPQPYTGNTTPFKSVVLSEPVRPILVYTNKNLCACGNKAKKGLSYCRKCKPKLESKQKTNETIELTTQKLPNNLWPCVCGRMIRFSKSLCKSCRRKLRAGKLKKKPTKRQLGRDCKAKNNGVETNKALSYHERNLFVEKMRYQSYQTYLKSARWRKIRKKVFEECGKFCVSCGDSATQVHHSRYTKLNLRGQNINFLHPVCEPCHYQAEFRDDGSKRSIKECNKLLGIS